MKLLVRMMPIKKYFILFLVVLVFSKCSNDEGGDLSSGIFIANLEGEWEATSANFSTINANPSQEVEVIATGGEVILEVSSDGRFIFVTIPADQNAQLITGKFTMENNLLFAEYDDAPGIKVMWNLQIVTAMLFLSGPIKFDFQNDGVFEEATADLDFVKK